MSSTLSYKGYEGSIEYSEDDGILYGRVLFIESSITYEGSNINELKTDFESAIDYHLEYCKKNGKTPETPFKGRFSVRVSPELHRASALYARKKQMNLNAVVREALEKTVVG